MSKSKVSISLCILISLLLIPVVSYSNNKLNPDKNKIMAKAMSLQIPFIENQGQVDKSVRFYANTFAGNVYVTEKGEIVYGLQKKVVSSNERVKSRKNQDLKTPNSKPVSDSSSKLTTLK